MKITREEKSARMLLSGFNMAFDLVRKHSYTGNRISELFDWLDTRQMILEEMAGIRKQKRGKAAPVQGSSSTEKE